MDLIRAKQNALEQQLLRMQSGKEIYDKLEDLASERDAEIFQIYQRYQLREEEAFAELRALGCEVPDDTLALNEIDFSLDGPTKFSPLEASNDLLTPPPSAGAKSETTTPVKSTPPRAKTGRRRGPKPGTKTKPLRSKSVKQAQKLQDCKPGDYLENASTIVLGSSGWVELKCSLCGGNSSVIWGGKMRYVKGIAGMKTHMTMSHGGKYTDADVVEECQVRTLSTREVVDLRASVRYDPVPRFPLSSDTKAED